MTDNVIPFNQEGEQKDKKARLSPEDLLRMREEQQRVDMLKMAMQILNPADYTGESVVTVAQQLQAFVKNEEPTKENTP